MGNISVMVKPASSACNLHCTYCFYTDVASSRTTKGHGVMSPETVELLAERIAEAAGFVGEASISFQGGEPTVAGLDWFRSFVRAMEAYPSISPYWSIQTNGTLLDEAWCDFFAEHDFLVGISLDGPRSNTNRVRLDAANEGVYDRVLHSIDLLCDADVAFNILTVVTRQLAQKPKQLMQFYVQHDFIDVQLIPCLPPLDGSDDGMSLRPADYRSFYLGLYRAWKRVYQSERLIHINLFENLLCMLMGEEPYQCGMLGECTIQYVIESNGDVYPCDFYCLDEYCMGNLADAPLHELARSTAAKDFIAGEACRRTPCDTCRFARICNGGCRRQNVTYLTEDRCAYQEVLNEVFFDLAQLYELYY